MNPQKRRRKIFQPTQRDIRRACEKIQEGWSDRERQKRSGQPDKRHWAPPVVDSSLLFPDFNQLSSEIPPQYRAI